MAKLIIIPSGGTVPKLNAKKLQDFQAQTAKNADLREGNLQPLKGITSISALGAGIPKTLWKTGGSFITFGDNNIYQVVDSPVDESNDRFIYTGDSYPKQSDSTLWPSTSRRLGVIAPTATPTITHDQGSAGSDVQQVVSYCFTMVTSWGEESAPSPLTDVDTIYEGEGITLGNLDTPAGGGNDWEYKRIYRLASGTVGAEYLFLAEIAYTETSYVDYDGAGNLNDVSTSVLPTQTGDITWEQPPNDISGITQAHNGMLIGYSGKGLYVTVPYVPYAWPSDYVLTFDSDITGVGALREFILVVTEQHPYIVTGNSPEGLSAKKINIKSTCANQRGVVACDRGIFYPAEDGLVWADESNVRVVTKEYITREQWAAAFSGDIIGAWYNNKYYAFGFTHNTGYIIDIDAGEIASFTTESPMVTMFDVYHDAADDTVNILSFDGSSDSNIHTFETNSTRWSHEWKSKKFAIGAKFNCAKVKGDFTSGSLTFKYYLNEALTHTESVTDESIFRLPEDPGSTDKEVQLSGNLTAVDSIQLATSSREIT